MALKRRHRHRKRKKTMTHTAGPRPEDASVSVDAAKVAMDFKQESLSALSTQAHHACSRSKPTHLDSKSRNTAVVETVS